jgi:hypothetical protein
MCMATSTVELPAEGSSTRSRIDAARAKVVVVGIATVLALAVGATSSRAAVPVQTDTSASTCAECCAGDATCEALAGLADLRATVVELVPQAGVANSLVAKIDAATRSVLKLNTIAALNQLDAFGNEVDALEVSDRSSAAVSNIMKTKHDTVKNSISNIR